MVRLMDSDGEKYLAGTLLLAGLVRVEWCSSTNSVLGPRTPCQPASQLHAQTEALEKCPTA